MPRGSAYAGRHRGRHRAIPEQRTRGLTLPGAAAAALTITATGAAVVPGLSGGTASATEGHRRPPEPAHTQPAPSSTLPVATTVADDDLVLAAQRNRIRASRAEIRKALVEKREAAEAKAHRWVLPVSHYRFTSSYGMRWGRLHAGDDFAAPIGTRIGSLSSGTVIFAGQESGYGNKVEVRHWDGTVSWYGHMSSIAVTVGEKVTPGEKLGEIGNTGHSTGPHLHLEIHPDGGPAVNPARWLAQHGLTI